MFLVNSKGAVKKAQQSFSRTLLPDKTSLNRFELKVRRGSGRRRERGKQYSFSCGEKSHAILVRWSSLYERNSSIKQLFKLPVGSSTGCKIYEQQYKQTVDGSKRVPEAAGRESLAITTQSITSSTRHIQPQAP